MPTTNFYPNNMPNETGSRSLVLVGAGIHEVVPSPPAGKVRLVANPLSSELAVAALLLAAENGGVPVSGAITGRYRVNATPISPDIPVMPDLYGAGGDSRFLVFLGEGEAANVDISAFAPPYDRAVGVALWKDFPTSELQLIRSAVFNIPQTVIIPEIAAGLMATAPLDGSQLSPTDCAATWLFNIDAIDHNFNVDVVHVASGQILTRNTILIPAGLVGSLLPFPACIPEGCGVVATILEATVAPLPFQACYKLSLSTP